MTRPFSRTRPYLLYAAASAWFCAPLFARPDGLGIRDWDQHLLHYGAVFRSLSEYVQPPFWNPWYCGGNVLWQNPQVALLSPVYLLAPFVSLALAMKLTIVLHYFLGFAGMHLLLTRAFRLSFFPVVLFLAALYTLAGAHTLHLAVGHSTFLPFFYLPLQLYGFLRAIETGRFAWSFGAAALMALAVWNGGVLSAALSGLALGVLALAAAITRRDWRPVLVAGTVALAAGLYAAPKLMPVAMFLSDERLEDTRGPVEEPDLMTWSMLARSLLDGSQTRLPRFPEQRHGWHEYGNYLGSLGVLLVLSSLLWIVADRPWRHDRWLGVSLAVTALVMLAVSAGQFGRAAPYALLESLPVFGSLRVPSRYLLPFTLFAVAATAWVVKVVTGDGPVPSKPARLASIVFIAATLQIGVQNRANLAGVFSLDPLQWTPDAAARSSGPEPDAATSPYGPDSPMLRAFGAGRALIDCYEPLQVQRRMEPDRPLVFAHPAVTIYETRFSPNRVSFTALTRASASRVFLNQNFVRGWRSDLGPMAVDEASGLGAVTLRGDQAGTFAFSFIPPGLPAGLLLLGVGLAGTIALRRRVLPGA